MKVGRPAKLKTVKQKDKFLRTLVDTAGAVHRTCEKFGIDPQTLSNARKDDPAFDKIFRKTKKECDENEVFNERMDRRAISKMMRDKAFKGQLKDSDTLSLLEKLDKKLDNTAIQTGGSVNLSLNLQPVKAKGKSDGN